MGKVDMSTIPFLKEGFKNELRYKSVAKIN
jgi:hypothetical protein